VYLSDELASMADSFKTNGANKSKLTSREREILQMIAEGKSSREIAERLDIGETTVKTHRLNMMAKLDIHDTAGLTRYAIRVGLTRMD
ncbi:MAG: LuxR C-terminal-related transcriptional regulator, partial [Pyrinomonadaceae bacterium]